MNPNPKCAVIGGGSWATALVKILSEKLEVVNWYMRSEVAKAHIIREQHHPNYLSAVSFQTDKLNLSNIMDSAITSADYLIFAIPSAFLHSELQKISVSLQDKIIFSAIKGIIPETGDIAGMYFHKMYGVSPENIGVITGPCHAEEVALERLSYLTISCRDQQKANTMAEWLSNAYIRTKVSDDIIGTEYAAMLKNIYAIAAGITHGLGYGDNFQSVLMSNAIREMKRFIKKVHHMKRNINDSAYLGDLLVTAYSVFSRNRMFGNMIGKGYTVKSAMMEMRMVAEGYYATRSAYLLNQSHIKKARTPIIDAIYAILYDKKSPRKIIQRLTEKLD